MPPPTHCIVMSKHWQWLWDKSPSTQLLSKFHNPPFLRAHHLYSYLILPSGLPILTRNENREWLWSICANNNKDQSIEAHLSGCGNNYTNSAAAEDSDRTWSSRVTNLGRTWVSDSIYLFSFTIFGRSLSRTIMSTKLGSSFNLEFNRDTYRLLFPSWNLWTIIPIN